MTFDAGARLLPTNLSGVVPDKLPSGISTRFSIGTVERACSTAPDNWPPALVRRTSHSPQRREPGIRVPCTVQVPSASWIACAGTGCATGIGEAGSAAFSRATLSNSSQLSSDERLGPPRNGLTWACAAAGRRMEAASTADKLRGDRGRIASSLMRRHQTPASPA